MKYLERSVALLALAACSGATHASVVQQLPHHSCSLLEIRERTTERAVLVVQTSGSPGCVPHTVAATLRPWVDGPLESWTVAVTRVPAPDTMALAVVVQRLRALRARDALDAESVFVETDDLELVEYARARRDLTVVALPWDRLYVQLSGSASRSLGAIDPATVRAEARPASPLPDCGISPDPRGPGDLRRSARAVYLLGDATGRELAERLVGLGSATEIAGLDSASFERSLASGSDAIYIIPLPLEEDGCAALNALLRRASWANSSSIWPLLETRAYVITRPGSDR